MVSNFYTACAHTTFSSTERSKKKENIVTFGICQKMAGAIFIPKNRKRVMNFERK